MTSVVVSFISFILHGIGGGLISVVVSFVSFILHDIGSDVLRFDIGDGVIYFA